MNIQSAFKFDQQTLISIGKGMLISFTGTGALGLLAYFGAIHFTNPTLALLASYMIPNAVNVIHQWMSGQAKPPQI